MAESIRADFPDWSFPGADPLLNGAANLFGAVMGRWGFRHTHSQFPEDVMVEAEAGVAYDARPVLSSITKPVLLIVGGNDADFPLKLVTETARLIPDCELNIYEGKDHTQTFFDQQVGKDILAFTNQASSTNQHPTT